MTKWILAAALATVAAASAQAHPMKHHAHPAKAAPDTVTIDGKEYKVCKPGVEDDCIQPREAGLGYGNRPTDVYRPNKADQHP